MAIKKFSTHVTDMFWVSKNFSYIMATQRTLNQGRATRSAYYIETNRNNFTFLKNQPKIALETSVTCLIKSIF